MEDGKKQVEEMTKIMQKHYERNGLLNFKWFAESAYKYITKNNVVLSGKQCVEMIQYNYNMGYKHGSKETAEKIINKVRAMLWSCNTIREHDEYTITPNIGYLMKDVDDGLDEIEKEFAKQFDVEIKE